MKAQKISHFIFIFLLLTCFAKGYGQSKKEMILAYEKHENITDEKRRELIDFFVGRDNSDYYVFPEIPRRKLRRAAKRAYIKKADVIVLIDAQIFGAAKNFLVIGTSGVYFRNDCLANSPGRHFIPFEEFKTKEIKIFQNEITIGDLSFDPTGSYADIDFILKVLTDLQQKL
ncbi:MAG: hypothetical protein ACJ77K_17235 [Bacteroidia bacterium]